MHWPFSPLRGNTINRRAVCGRSARTVRREGGPDIRPSLPLSEAGRPHTEPGHHRIQRVQHGQQLHLFFCCHGSDQPRPGPSPLGPARQGKGRAPPTRNGGPRRRKGLRAGRAERLRRPGGGWGHPSRHGQHSQAAEGGRILERAESSALFGGDARRHCDLLPEPLGTASSHG